MKYIFAIALVIGLLAIPAFFIRLSVGDWVTTYVAAFVTGVVAGIAASWIVEGL